MSVTKKIDNSKILDTCFFCFSIFEAVWRSRNLERVYIFSTKAILRPPCRRYGGDPVTKKIIKKYWTAISAFFDIRSRLALTQPRMFIYRYIYIIRANLRPPCRRYRGGSSTKKIDNPKILDMGFLFFDIFSSLALTQPRTSLYILFSSYIEIELAAIDQSFSCRFRSILIPC